ncbi:MULTISPECIES: toxin-antitoxin system HicB family antitoxin [Bilophila]|uniref:toxin-antitoxin system HicB family antitoxin n=1 Tax=Bilophila TaxID=35832 RepID=UPI00338FC016
MCNTLLGGAERAGTYYAHRFNVRLSPDLHQRLASLAARSGKSINTWMNESLPRIVEQRG